MIFRNRQASKLTSKKCR